jgi:hypothetical protein
MKKQMKKLTLAKETLRDLHGLTLNKVVAGGTTVIVDTLYKGCVVESPNDQP